MPSLPPEPCPHEIVERARGGDRVAFDAVVSHYAGPLVRFLTSVLSGDAHGAHDVAQEAFLATWRALPGLAEPRRLKSWMYRTAWHMAMTWRRRLGPVGARMRTFGTLAPAGGEPPDFAHPEPVPRRWALPDGWTTTEEATPRLRATLSSLPGRYAAPLTLFYLRGLSLLQTAEALGVPCTTVKMRLHRARGLLRDRMLGVVRTRRRRRRRPPVGAHRGAGGLP